MDFAINNMKEATALQRKNLALHTCGMLSANNQRKFSYDLS